MKSGTADKNPGPGHYSIHNNAGELRKKVWGKQGVFGSSEKRFPVHTSLEIPGPGFYDISKEGRIEIGQSAIFKSPMREQKIKENNIPPIGQYDTSLETIERKLKKQIINSSPRQRRVGESNYAMINKHNSKNRLRDKVIPRNEENQEDYLGPGYYYIPREFDETTLGFKGNTIIPKGKRFQEKINDIPGPGAYMGNNMDQWNKKTYNLIFNNDNV